MSSGTGRSCVGWGSWMGAGGRRLRQRSQAADGGRGAAEVRVEVFDGLLVVLEVRGALAGRLARRVVLVARGDRLVARQRLVEVLALVHRACLLDHRQRV